METGHRIHLAFDFHNDASGRLHATSIIIYDVPDGITRFRARCGVDSQGTEEGGGSTVQFMVFTKRPQIEVPARAEDGRGEDDEEAETIVI